MLSWRPFRCDRRRVCWHGLCELSVKPPVLLWAWRERAVAGAPEEEIAVMEGLLAGGAVLIGLVVLLYSADRFVDGAVGVSRHFGMPTLLIGMVVIGFGTSAPEMVVSAISALQGNPGLALGNAYGSNITNIALILGLTAVLRPIAVHSHALRKELPLLLLMTLVAAVQLWDGHLSRLDALVLLLLFAGWMGWSIRQAWRRPGDALGSELEQDLILQPLPLRRAVALVLLGLVLLTLSSRLLVWGAVRLAQGFGVSDLIIGLTIVAIGTSLPELASSLAATRKGEHDLVLGNVLGSNLFNTLAVVGIAGAIEPLVVEPAVLGRDMLTVAVLTAALLLFGFGFTGFGRGRINRFEGALLLVAYGAYNGFLVWSLL